MDESELSRQHLGESLFEACDPKGSVEIVRELLRKGADVNWKIKPIGWTALHTACVNNRPDIVRLLLEYNPNVNQQTEYGNTALHLACYDGYLNCVKFLLATGQHDLAIVNFDGRSPIREALHEGKHDIVKYLRLVDMNKHGFVLRMLKHAISEGDLDFSKYLVMERNMELVSVENKVVRRLMKLAVRESDINFIKYLIEEKRVDVNGAITKSGATLMEVAVHKGKLDVIKYLVTEQNVDVNVPANKSGVTLLGLVVHEGNLEIFRYLVNEQRVDINGPVTECGNTPLEVAVCGGKLDIIDYLVTEKNLDVVGHHLFLACEHQQASVVKYILTNHHIDPNIKDNCQRTPLSLAKSKKVIKLLIQHGADAENVYALHRKILNNIFSKDPVKSPVKIFVIGHAGEGKSTLIKAMEHEPTLWSSASKEVHGVDQRTAGIIPRVFKSRFYGNVLFYDFAGQEAYYSSHAAIVKSAITLCPPVFLLVIGLHRDDTAITHSVSYWLGIITNQCIHMENKAPLIIVGSHADLVKGEAEIERVKSVISLAVQKFTFFDLVDIVAIDCRYSNSDGMKLLRHHVEASCNSLRSSLSVCLNSHMFLIYLIDNYSSELFVTLQQVRNKLKADPSKKEKNILSFVPTTIPRLVEICVQLSDKGHILFLLDKSSPEESFIIIDRAALLAEINGPIFAPEHFKQHCQLSTSTGVVPRSKLAEHFDRFDINMLVRFISHLELAIPIEDEQVLKLISEHSIEANKKGMGNEKGYLFCPALIRLKAPSKVFTNQARLSYHFGWVLSCVRTDDFFNARFLHVLLLRLALSLGLAPVIDPDIPALQHQCSVWKTGVCWSTRKGAEVLVEILNKKEVVVLIQSQNVSCDLLTYQTTIIVKVKEAAREFCPSINTEEVLLPPSDVTYPLSITQTTALFSLKSVAQSVVQNDPFVVSINGIGHLAVSDLEVYANLGENILQALFNENDPAYINSISDQFLAAISSSWRKNPQLVSIIYSAITRNIDTISPNVVSVEKMEAALNSWRDNNSGTYKSLRQILDPISVFAGENPLELAGVQYKDFDESLVSSLEPAVSSPSRTESNALSLDDLMMEYGIDYMQLDTKIEENDFQGLADCFDCVEDYLYELRLTAGQQTDIKDLAFRHNTKTAMAEALKLWRQPNPLSATFQALILILLDLRRGDVAVKVCRYIIDNVPKLKKAI